MTTKFRSACDRCHDTKVRCSGDMPCQGCLTSKSLCFYSVSNPLGRPRGTKNKTSRNRSHGNSSSEGNTTPDRDRANEQGPNKKPTNRRRKGTKGSRSGSEPSSAVAAESQQPDGPTLLTSSSGTQTPTETNMWLALGDEGRHIFGMPDIVGPSDFRMDCFSPVDSGIDTATQILGDTPQSTHHQLDAPPLDVTMSNFPCLDESDAQCAFAWDSLACNTDKHFSDLVQTGGGGSLYSQSTTQVYTPTSFRPLLDD